MNEWENEWENEWIGWVSEVTEWMCEWVVDLDDQFLFISGFSIHFIFVRFGLSLALAIFLYWPASSLSKKIVRISISILLEYLNFYGSELALYYIRSF